MTSKQFFVSAAAGAAFMGIVVAGMLINSPRLKADDDGNSEESKVKIGFAINPVHLNLEGKNRELVGLGSFIVNAQADCNGCHTSGGPPNFNYANGGNPYFGPQTKNHPTPHLARGTDFFSPVPPLPCAFPPPAYGS